MTERESLGEFDFSDHISADDFTKLSPGKYLGKTIYFSKPEKKNDQGAFILEVREIGDNVLLLTSDGIVMLRSREWLEADKSRSAEEK